MFNLLTILKAAFILLCICATATAAARRPDHEWLFYHFDGKTFVSGKLSDGTPYMAVGDGVQPVVTNNAAGLKQVPLPSGKGAVAGIVFVQSSGGKLGDGAGYIAVPQQTLRALSGEAVAATFMSNEEGYFTAALAPGRYRIGNGPFYVTVTVTEGKTTIVPIRTGKRMVD